MTYRLSISTAIETFSTATKLSSRQTQLASLTMCREMIVHFTRCRHRAQTLTICGRNGTNPPEACHGAAGRFIQLDTVCHGCHEIVVYTRNTGSTFEDVKTANGVTSKMPFGYVIYGRLPRSRWEGHESSHNIILVGLESDGVDPLEKALVRLDAMRQTATAQTQQTTSAYKEWTAKPPTKSSLKATKAKERRGKPHHDASAHPSKRSVGSPSTISLPFANALPKPKSAQARSAPRPTKSLSSGQASTASSGPRHSPSSGCRTEETQATSTSRSSRSQRASFKRSTSRPEAKQQVSFADNVVVQYFNKEHKPMAVEYHGCLRVLN